jgi:hypothetical protein
MDFVGYPAVDYTTIANIFLVFITGGLVCVGLLQVSTSRAQLRAYVFVSSGQISSLGQAGILKVRLVVQNFGQTPAYKTSVWLEMIEAAFPAEPSVFAADDIKVKNLTLGPGGQNAVSIGRPDWPGKTFLSTEAFYVYGRIEYLDCFNRKQKTNFRLYKGGPSGVSGADLNFATDGNQAT